MSDVENQNDVQGQNSIYQNREGMEFYNPERKEIYDRFDEFVNIVFVKGKQIDWMKSRKEGKLMASEANDFNDLLKSINVKEDDVEKDKTFYETLREEKLEDYLSYIYLLGATKKPKSKIDKFKSEKIFPKEGLWSRGGSDMKLPKNYLTLLYIFKKYFDGNQCENVQQAENKIKGILENLKDKDKKIPVINFLLHFCDPTFYSTDPLITKQEELVEKLKFLLDEEEKKDFETTPLDGKIKKLHDHLISITGLKNHGCIFGQFEEYLNCKDDGKSDFSKLKFKKAVILYGPPGTSKTYSAKKLAKTVIQDYCIEKCIELYKGSNDVNDKNKQNTQKEIQKALKDLTQYVHRIQLHPNYSYEDFIWGYEIKDSGKGTSISQPKKGYFIDLLEKMKNDEMPHVLILDEINRVDLSRLFGELFSAIENRGEDVDLPVSFPDPNGTVNEKYKINIPDNLFIIGTMNEIDFSLERIDFALRRRFAWIFKGFEEKILKQMLIEKDGDFDYEDYINKCKKLNEKIEKDMENLGKKYVIGHTIFADIASIRQQLEKKANINSENTKDNDDGQFDEARKLLWEISIKPLLEAYLGNMEESEQQNKINDFAKTFGIENAVNNPPVE